MMSQDMIPVQGNMPAVTDCSDQRAAGSVGLVCPVTIVLALVFYANGIVVGIGSGVD